MAENEGGRPTVMTEEILRKLREAFLIGCTDVEACLYANIGKSTLYDYQLLHPEFVEEKEDMKHNPLLKARTTIFNALDKPSVASWYAERKAKNEFAFRTEHTGEGGEPIKFVDTIKSPEDLMRIVSSVEAILKGLNGVSEDKGS